jgi:hypothetical protein
MKVTTAGVPKYKQLVPVLSKTSLTNLAKFTLKGGIATLAVTGSIEALGYLIDSATGDLKKSELVVPDRYPALPDNFAQSYYVVSGWIVPKFPDGMSACSWWVEYSGGVLDYYNPAGIVSYCFYFVGTQRYQGNISNKNSTLSCASGFTLILRLLLKILLISIPQTGRLLKIPLIPRCHLLKKRG